MFDSEMSVTGWFHALRAGDEQAARNLWTRYFDRVRRVAEAGLPTDPAYDADDFAVSVFDALFSAAGDGRYADISDRNELWAMLLVIARRKRMERHRRVSAQKRSGSDGTRRRNALPEELAAAASDEPTPELAALLADECRRLLERLNRDNLQQVALLKLDGYSIAEIAKNLEVGERTVKRKLQLIRTIWQDELQNCTPPHAERHEHNHRSQT